MAKRNPGAGFMNPTPQQAAAREKGEKETPVEMVQLNAQLPKELRHRFKVKATQQGTSMSELINTWVSEYVAGKR